MDTITIKGMHFYGYHGCLPEEQRTGQPFHVDAVLYADLSKAGASDELNDTIDYSKVYQLVQSIVEGRTYRLIERLAAVIADEVLAAFPVDAVRVAVHKPQAPIGGPFDDVAVTVERRRHGQILYQRRRKSGRQGTESAQGYRLPAPDGGRRCRSGVAVV